MSHPGPEALRRILGGAGGPQEIETAAEHIVFCGPCRALAAALMDELRTECAGQQGESTLRLVFDLIDRENKWGVESLAALTEWAELRRMNRRQQRDRVRMTKACHTIAFFNLVLGEIKETSAWEEAEFLAALAFLSVERMSQRQQITPAASNDLQAKVWIEIVNARRLAAEWKRADQALVNARRYRKEGTGDPLLHAKLLSIEGAILAEKGEISAAIDALERCRTIYENFPERSLLARTLVKIANILIETAPDKGLKALDQAVPLIPAEDSNLTLLAELLRVRYLIELQRPTEALHVYRRCSKLFLTNPKLRLRIRGRFAGAQLLDALGHPSQAERLFEEVVNSDIEHELYKDAFLDLLYLYSRHMKAGAFDKAARVCQRALTDATLSAMAHEEIRALWAQLLEAAQRQAFSQDLLRDVRQYLNIHWKHPAGTTPVVVR